MKNIDENKFEKIYGKCEKIYEKSGSSSVIEFIEKKREQGKVNYHKIDYHYCKACEANMPCLNDTCLVCASGIEKVKLKSIKKTMFVVEYHDFEKFVESIYGGTLELVAVQELNNDSHLNFDVGGENYTMVDKSYEEKIRSGVYPNYCFYHIIRCLCDDGYLTENGEYTIDISW